jgi:hypothetical protein
VASTEKIRTWDE